MTLEWRKNSHRSGEDHGTWTLGDLAFIAGVLVGQEIIDTAWREDDKHIVCLGSGHNHWLRVVDPGHVGHVLRLVPRYESGPGSHTERISRAIDALVARGAQGVLDSYATGAHFEAGW